MHSKLPVLTTISLLSAFISLSALNSTAQTPTNDQLEKAFSFLRRLDHSKVNPDDQERVAREIDDAWSTIAKAGPAGRTRLKQELGAPGQTDYFRLSGAALLWAIGGLDEAEFIAGVWRSTRLEAQPNYVFYPTFQAANKQDERALPMLRVVLGNSKLKIFVPLHSMKVDWPRTVHFIWGAYGPKRLTVLLDVLKKSQNPVEVQSALYLFANDQYLDALPRIRELARAENDETRRAAIYALGFYGHPEDYDFLVAGLRSPNAEDRFYFAMAVYEYEDLRAVPHLISLLDDSERKVRREAVANLTHLLTAQAFDALIKYSRQAQADEKAEVDNYLQSELKAFGLSLSSYERKSPIERTNVISSMRQKRDAGAFLLRAGEKGFTRDEFLKAADEWKRKHRLPVSAPQILTAANANDIDLLLEVKAAVFSRLSDECLYEAERIDVVVRRLGRSRYRKEVGITERVEAR